MGPSRRRILPGASTCRRSDACAEMGVDDRQAASLLAALAPLARTMVGLALLSGLRRGELFALRWKDIDEQARLLTVREAVYDGFFGTPKTEAGLGRFRCRGGRGELMVEWKAQRRNGAGRAGVRARGGHTDLAEQRAAPVDLSGVQAAGAAARDVADVPADLFVVVARQRRTRQGRRAADGTRQRRHDVERVHAGARRSVRDAVEKVAGELFTIVHKTEQAETGNGGN